MRLAPSLLLPVILGVIVVAYSAPVVGAQASASPTISLSQQYTINNYGYGVLNETISFVNNGTSPATIPQLQLGIPTRLASNAAGWLLVSNGSTTFTDTSANSGNLTVFTISPSSSSLAAGANGSVSLKSFLSGVLNATQPTQHLGVFVLLSPSLDVKVSMYQNSISLPTSGTLTPAPKGYSVTSSSTSPIYTNKTQLVTPQASLMTLGLGSAGSSAPPTTFTPVDFYSQVDAIVPSVTAYPLVTETISIRNLGSSAIDTLPLSLLSPSITNVTVLPSSTPPTINPKELALSGGVISLTGAPFGGGIQSGDNFTLTIQYPLPHSFVSTSGDAVTLKVPFKTLLPAVVANYTVSLRLPNGISPSGPTRILVTNATDLKQGTVDLTYAVSPGWAADQAVPEAALVFAVAFVFLAVRRQTPSRADTKFEEEEEEAEEREDAEAEGDTTKDRLSALTDLLQALGDKIALINETVDEFSPKPQGTVARAEFTRRRNDLDALRNRSLRSLGEARQRSTSDTLTTLLNQVQEAEREEDRAAKDILNLFDQYQSRRMRTETYRRLLPNYRRRLDAAINKLSDLLSRAQGEAR